MTQFGQNGVSQELEGQPIYNIKAVVEATGLPAATLRAWERRYNAFAPGRTERGYRLYSARDIAALRWLKARLAEGLSISHAIALLGQQQEAIARPTPMVRTPHLHALTDARETLVKSLLMFDEQSADTTLEEAFATYGLESVTEYLIAPTMMQIGDLWHKGEASISAEHFASNYLRRKLEVIINAAPNAERGPLVVLGCAPNDWHELGLLLIYLHLRRRHVRTLYLGQNISPTHLVEELERLQPFMVTISATTSEAVQEVIDLSRTIAVMAPPKPIFAYGGRAFNKRPDLCAQVVGVFLGESMRSAVEYTMALVQRATPAVQRHAPAMT